ncbi:MAG: hypothetical protein Q7R96_05335 [Nanoarchaeota archaeon]|nr:hypothetical protein [Nanoarchaeota archaeon]
MILDTIAEYHPEYLISPSLTSIAETPPLILLQETFWKNLYEQYKKDLEETYDSEELQPYLIDAEQRLMHTHRILTQQTIVITARKYRKAYVEGGKERMITRILQAKGLTTIPLDEGVHHIFSYAGDHEGKQLYHGEREQAWNKKISTPALDQSILIIGAAHADDEFRLEQRLRERNITLHILEGFNETWKTYKQIHNRYMTLLLQELRRRPTSLRSITAS